MIIFYEKKTGKIRGTIDGRIHPKEHLNMWVGDKEKIDRIVVNWKVVKHHKDKKGNIIASDFEPNHPQKRLFMTLDKAPINIYKYKINLKTKKFIKKEYD